MTLVQGASSDPATSHAVCRRMSRAIKDRRQKAVKRRNPVARALRAAAFRARQEANRRRYSRKLKHKPKPDADPD